MPEVPEDCYIRSSSVRLALIAAGLVNSAVAILLTRLSNSFFELAIADMQLDAKVSVDTKSSGRKPKDASQSNSGSQPLVDVEIIDKDSVGFVAKTSTPSKSSRTVDEGSVNDSCSPLQVIRIKEEVDVDFGSFIDQISTPSNSTGPPRPSGPLINASLSGLIDPPRLTVNNSVLQTPSSSSTSRVATWTYLKRYSCDTRGCGKVFFSRSSLFYHKQSHSVDKPYTCPHTGCTAAFTTDSLLQSHVQLHRSGSVRNQFCCNYPGCNKVFICQDRLVEHIRIHTGERPYVCDHPDCSFRFARRGNLFAHKRVHVDKTQRRQYHCVHPGCGKTFLYTRSLTEHMNVHMGERPYRCEFPNCDKSFTSKSYLHAHRRIHMGTGTNGSGYTERNEPSSAYSLTPFPVSMTVPVQTESDQHGTTTPQAAVAQPSSLLATNTFAHTSTSLPPLLQFPDPSQASSTFSLYPFYPDHHST